MHYFLLRTLFKLKIVPSSHCVHLIVQMQIYHTSPYLSHHPQSKVALETHMKIPLLQSNLRTHFFFPFHAKITWVPIKNLYTTACKLISDLQVPSL